MAQQMPQPISRQLGKETRSASAGNAVFKGVLSQDVDWKAFGAFPPSARIADVVGQPSQPGPYTVRVEVTQGVKPMPHRHPEDRIYTVISGLHRPWRRFDSDKPEAYPPGADRSARQHIAFPPGEIRRTLTQVSAIGPLGMEYVN